MEMGKPTDPSRELWGFLDTTCPVADMHDFGQDSRQAGDCIGARQKVVPSNNVRSSGSWHGFVEERRGGKVWGSYM